MERKPYQPLQLHLELENSMLIESNWTIRSAATQWKNALTNMTKNDHAKVLPKTEALGFALDQDSRGEANLRGHSESGGVLAVETHSKC
jgi:hypothetical protein